MRALLTVTLALQLCGCATPAQVARPTASAEAARQGSTSACASPRDCGAGLACCTTPLWDTTYCAARCDLANTGQVCDQDSECPEIGGVKTSCAPVSSENEPTLPASLRICQ